MNCSSSVPNDDSGVPALENASRAISRTCDPTSGSPASDSPRSRPPWTIFSPPARTTRPASANAVRSWNSCQITDPQKVTHSSVATSATSSLLRASGDSLQILIIVGLQHRGCDRRRRSRSGLVELAIDGAQDEPGGLCTLAAELFALVLLEGSHQVREIEVHR